MDGLSNFTDSFVLARIVAEKVLFSRRGNLLVKRRGPANNTVFVNVNFGKTAFFEQGNNAFRVKRPVIMQNFFGIPADKAAVIL